MGKDAHDGADCCHACERWASTPAEPVERAPLPAAQPDDLVIEITERGTPVLTYIPTSSTITLGRGSDNHITLESGAVSKRQLAITLHEGDVLVRDLKSNCGTYLDGRGIQGPTKVGDGAVISFANFDLRVIRR